MKERPAFDELAEAPRGPGSSSARRGRAYAGLQTCWPQLLERYRRRYAELKDARSALDFEDLELAARDLLRLERRVLRDKTTAAASRT